MRVCVFKSGAFPAGLIVASTVIAMAGRGLADEPDAESRAGWNKLAERGQGFVVWESNRSGRWRIYRRELDGSNLRQIDPDDDREHYCPHLSPDGTRLVYLSYPVGSDTYQPQDPPGGARLHLMQADGTADHQIAASARAYYEDRGVVWIDDDTLIYIDGEGVTRQLQPASGDSIPLTKAGLPGGGYLINATKTHATTGEPSFATYDFSTLDIASQQSLGGCQPYFTHDGKWGFWMGGAGGPINRINLATREASPILAQNDPRMPKGRRYLYFPMISRDGRWLAFAASPNEHDHFHADYDIFIARMNRRTLELIDAPVRYSFDRGTDRFPDVFVMRKKAVSEDQSVGPTLGRVSNPSRSGIAPDRTRGRQGG